MAEESPWNPENNSCHCVKLWINPQESDNLHVLQEKKLRSLGEPP